MPVPEPTAIYLSLAEKELRAATDYLDAALQTSIEFDANNSLYKIIRDVESGFFDCLQSIVAGVIFSFTSIEVFANSKIPEDYTFSQQRHDKKCTETYTREQAERFITLDIKLDKLLPEICKVKSPKGTKLWERYIGIKELRDRLIHLKTMDWQQSAPQKADDYIWTHVLSPNTRNVAKYAFELICHYFPNQKPRWAERFGANHT
jgi:hypothetical protein